MVDFGKIFEAHECLMAEVASDEALDAAQDTLVDAVPGLVVLCERLRRERDAALAKLQDRDEHLAAIRALLPVGYLEGRPTHSAVAEHLADLRKECDHAHRVEP